jgi:hypothetical protein
MGYVPVAAVPAANVSTEVPEPATLVGLKPAEVPLGTPDAVSATVPLKSVADTLMVEVPLPPCVVLTEVGLAPTEKQPTANTAGASTAQRNKSPLVMSDFPMGVWPLPFASGQSREGEQERDPRISVRKS